MKILINKKIEDSSNIIIFDLQESKSLLQKSIFDDAKKHLDANQAEFKKNGFLNFVSNIKNLNRIVLINKSYKDSILLKVFNSLYIKGNSKVSIISPNSIGNEEISSVVQKLSLYSYSYTYYKERKDYISEINIVKEDQKKLDAILKKDQIVTDAIVRTRDLSNTPPSDLNPKTFCKYIEKEFKNLSVKISIFNEKDLLKKGLNMIEAVSRGSNNKSALVRLEFGKSYKTKPIVLVGKGVTYDSGGINIKPSAGGWLEYMKDDMTGAATVLNVFKALHELNLKKHIICYLPLAENMLGDRAYKPGDILKSYNGKTVEVKNTDAEGRLVLADAISYASKNDKPEIIIDVATLTGASIVALGFDYTPFYSNNNKLSENIRKSADRVFEKVWEMPLDDCYLKYIEGDISDLKNVHEGMNAGSITAAKFLEQFVGKNVKWSHFDIGGAVLNKEQKVDGPKGASGVLVKSLIELISNI